MSKGLLATLLREVLKADGLPKKLAISSEHSAAAVALEIFTPLARKIVRHRY